MKLQKIINSDLCNRCGSCVGLSNGKIIFDDKIGNYLPKILLPLDNQEDDFLYSVCSGKGFDFPKNNQELFPNTPHHKYIGAYKKIFIGYANKEEIRSKAASGGIISGILIWLLENNFIDGAVVTRMSPKEPWLTEAFIATSKEEILESAQSKYIITSVNEILPEIERFHGKLAYVGLPGQVQSIRNLNKIRPDSVKAIKYIFGPFYGNTLHFSSIISLLRSYGEKNYTNIKKLYFRHGEWPGKMRIELSDNRIFELKKFHANYLIPFHILKNSLLCTDLSNEFTDISGGDAWAPVYEERGKGFSIVIARNEESLNLLKLLQNEKVLHLNEISVEEAITMHSHGYDLKKRGAFIRLTFRRFLGKINPAYNYTISGFTFTRYLMELLLDSMFIILNNKLSRRIVEIIPLSIIGALFENARDIWKKLTFSIKRKDL